jgi:alkylation response protein AidB-like acyl-CoA dehydrogenase
MTAQERTRDPFELQPTTEAGRRLLALCEEHAADFATRAAAHDREGSFPAENIAALQRSGVMAAAVPEELGGMGVSLSYERALGINRLARGDGATAIAANMHISNSADFVSDWRAARSAGDAAAEAALEELLIGIGSGQIVSYAPISEVGTDILHPLVEGTRTETGWRLNGRKIFGTLAPAAHLAFVLFRGQDGTDGERTYGTLIPVGTAGMEVQETWDALGMRATGSHDTVFFDCDIPGDGVIDVGPWGEWSPLLLVGSMNVNLGLIAAFLGIAEAARDQAIKLVTTRHKAPGNRPLADRPGIQHLVAENEIDLAAARAMLERTGRAIDAALTALPAPDASLAPLHVLHRDFQCAKYVVTQHSIRIVDRALTLSGGAGYLTKSPLSRLYRDVRAGPFMQPFSPNEAFEYIGKVTLGLNPTLAG